jgi:exonuclease III
MANDLTGSCFDYLCLPAVGASGAALVAWRRDLWAVSQPVVRTFSLTLKLRPLDCDGIDWWLTNVYGPASRADKPAFLNEIRDTRAAHPGPLLICGDFNVIYQAADKKNGRLHRGLMRDFRRVIDDLQLQSDRSFTWSNERDQPTLER